MSLNAHNYMPLTDPGEETQKVGTLHESSGFGNSNADSDDEDAASMPVYDRKDFNLILFFTFILSLNAGVVNALTVLFTSNAGFPPFTASHHTGTVTRIGISIARHYVDGGSEAWNWAALAVSFALGSATTGFFIRSQIFHPNRKYGALLVLEGVMLIATGLVAENFLNRRDEFIQCIGRPLVDFEDSETCLTYRSKAVLLAAFGSYACGIQNALCTNLTGAVVRTTHATGLLTDLGMLIGETARWFTFRRAGQPPPQLWRFKVWLIIFWGFVFGCAISTKGYDAGFSNRFTAFMIDIIAIFFIIFGLIWVFKRLDMRYRSGGRDS